MTEKNCDKANKVFELRLCPNGTYYLYKNNELMDIDFDKFNKESAQECVDLLNSLNDEREHYKSIFFEIVETALTDKNCRELYCKGILDIFDKANSLNQARDIIKEHLND